MGGALLVPGLSRFSGAIPTPAYPFEEMLAAETGIRWKHTAGHSQQKYLPETTGAGCAFLDYDDDGWMDTFIRLRLRSPAW